MNADDFGLTRGISQAILELNLAGALTSTTLMATGQDFPRAAAAAGDCRSLGVGCHVTFVDGTPALPASEIPSLADPATGRFRPTLGAFVSSLLRGHIRDRDLEAEATAQIQKIQKSGLKVTHVDTHKHVHMFARVLRPVLRAALVSKVPAIRNPFEPPWSRRATPGANRLRRLQVGVLGLGHSGFLSAVRHAGLITTDGAVGVLATGTLDVSTLTSLLAALPHGTWELCCHPGYSDPDLATIHTRLRGSRDTERRALAEVLPNQAGIELIHFGSLVAPKQHPQGRIFESSTTQPNRKTQAHL